MTLMFSEEYDDWSFMSILDCKTCGSLVEVYFQETQENVLEKKRRRMTIQNPLFQPPSEWVCPEYIDYKGQSPVAIDLETYDPGIKDHGPGWATGNGKVVGVAIAWDGFKGYFSY
jgi:hypothetical protein